MSENPKPRRWRFDGRDIASAWTEWRRSEQGRNCAEGAATGQYLENRLHMAFDAGMEAALKLADEAQSPRPATEVSR